MNKLSKECIEAIEKSSPYLNPMDAMEFTNGATEAITNPSIYSKAGLISLEQLNDLDDFIRWRSNNYYISQHFGGWVSKDGIGSVTRTSAELFLAYQEFYKS